MTDFLVTSAQAWARPHGGDLTQAFVFQTILDANLQPLPLDDPMGLLAAAGEDDDRAPKRPISVHAVATSLSLPYETVRRKVVSMEAMGLIARDRQGVVVRSAALRTQHMRAAMAEVRTLLGQALTILEKIGLDLSAFPSTAEASALHPPGDPVIARIVAGAQIRMLERIAPIFGDVIGAYLFGGVLRANQSELLINADMAWRYATQETLAPDEVRLPVTVSTLSKQLGLPLETVRRQVRRMTQGGYVIATDQGVVAPVSIIAGEADEYQSSKMSLEFFRMLGGLAQVGFLASLGNRPVSRTGDA